VKLQDLSTLVHDGTDCQRCGFQVKVWVKFYE